MCVISMVMDQFGKDTTWPWNQIPNNPVEFTPIGTPVYQPSVPINIFSTTLTKEDINRLEKIIADFKEACSLAEKLDILLKKPDCIDPEKAKLIERVAELEKQLEAIKNITNG